jgi:hypothetical protein
MGHIELVACLNEGYRGNWARANFSVLGVHLAPHRPRHGQSLSKPVLVWVIIHLILAVRAPLVG